jgi:hypothetical protein
MNFFSLVYDNTIGLIPEPFKTIAMVACLAVFGIVSGFKAVQRVPAGHTGILLFLDRVVLYYDKSLTKEERRFQKAVDKALIKRKKLARYGRPIDLDPGFRKMVPFFNKIEIVDTRSKTYSLGEIQVISSKERYTGSKFPDVHIPINVLHTYQWKYRTDNIEQRLVAIARTELAKTLRSYVPDDGILTPEIVENISYHFLKAVYFQFAWNGAKATSLLLGTEMPILDGWMPQSVTSLSTDRDTPSLRDSPRLSVAPAIAAASFKSS